MRSMPREVKIVAECYANACFGEKVKQVLIRTSRHLDVNVLHNRFMGRDRVIKFVKRTINQYKDVVLVAIIDYERGPLREYIDVFFRDLEPLQSNQKILVGRGRRGAIAGVIFDPDPEEVFAMYSLKSETVCNKLERSLGETLNALADKVVTRLIEMKLI